jgi:predicted nucleic acid-binding protein
VTDCILDVSVAAKRFLPPAPETLVPEARQLLKDYRDRKLRVVVPDLFWLEAGNVLWKAARRGLVSLSSAEEALQTLDEWNFPTAPSRPLLKQAFAIAASFHRTVYDATYVALAVASSFPLITADERLADALAARMPVRWLGSL